MAVFRRKEVIILAEFAPNVDKNRQRLADIIPLSHPFTVYIEQTKYCNFKCYYCMHSSHDQKDGVFYKKGHKMQNMDFELYKRAIGELKELGVKRIVFSGLGEPLMNPDFPKFVKYAVDAKIAERVEVITNGALITPKYADDILSAGITNINISIQGINGETYEKICGAKVDFDEFIKNLTYLFNSRGNTKIYIKCIDAILKNEDERKKFFDVFGNICDRIYIEHLVVMQQSMDILHETVDVDKNLYGELLNKSRDICSPAFYFLQIGADGLVYPCPIPGLTSDFAIGDMNKNTLKEIWNGDPRKKFLYKMLNFERKTITQCKGCACFNCISDPKEYLDDDAERLKGYFV